MKTKTANYNSGFNPHEGQQRILREHKRFTVVLCGRRFGKTKLINKILFELFRNKRIAVFAPTQAQNAETFAAFSEHCENINALLKQEYIRIDNMAKTMSIGAATHSNPTVRFFSVNNAGNVRKARGFKFKIAIYEEFQSFQSNDLREHWTKVVRPLLADERGECWFFGTPPPTHKHYAYQLILQGAYNSSELRNAADIQLGKLEAEPDDNIVTIRMPTHANPYIAKDEIDAMKKSLPGITFEQEIMALCVEQASNLWVSAFEQNEVQKRVLRPKINLTDLVSPTWLLSFDFNITPGAAILCAYNSNCPKPYFYVVKEFGSKERSTLYAICEQIRFYFQRTFDIRLGKWDGKPHPPSGLLRNLIVTGDATGTAGNVMQRSRDMNAYKIIQDELSLAQQQLKVNRVNPTHANSHIHVNSYLELHRDIAIDESACPSLVTDCKSARRDDENHITKKDYDPHYLDTLRYALDIAFKPGIIANNLNINYNA